MHGPGVDEPLVWYEGAGLSDRRWLHADNQGSIIAESNGGGAGTLYAYGPYGEPQNWGGARFRYTGQAALFEVSLYHYKARVYDPMLGRFLQTDPVGYEDNLNLYVYVADDPMNSADSSGTCGTGSYTGTSFYCESTGGGGRVDLGSDEAFAHADALHAQAAATQNPYIRGQLETQAARAEFQGGVAAIAEELINNGLTIGENALGMVFGGPEIRMLPAVLRNGQVIEFVANTSQGAIHVLAEVRISGRALQLESAAIYSAEGRAIATTNAMRGELRALGRGLANEASQHGFTSVTISGTRYSGAAPGRTATATFRPDR